MTKDAMSEPEITITVSIPPLWSDGKIEALAKTVGNPWVAAAMRSAALQLRYDYEAERLRLIQRIAFLERMLNDVANSEDE